MVREICLICQKFLIYSCQDVDDPDIINAFYLADFTPGTRHSSLYHTPTHTHTHEYKRTKASINLINYLEFNEQNGKVESKSVVQYLGDC